MEHESNSAEFESDGAYTDQLNEHSGEEMKSRNHNLPEEIILKADYSCYCTVCDCTLSRIKDAIQHASGKRHKKACSTKRPATGEFHDNAKKAKTEETEEEEEAKKMLSKVFDETFHGGVVALRDNYYCKVCRCMIGNNRKNVNQHKEGKSHKMALEKFKQSLLSGTIGDDIPVEDPNQPFEGDGYVEKTKNAKKKTTYYCRLCDVRTKDRDVITQHMNDQKHQQKIHFEKRREMFEQQGGYYGYQNEYYGGAEGQMYSEGYNNEMGMEGSGSWNECRDDYYYDRGQPSDYGMSFDGEPANKQELPLDRWNQPFHGGFKNDTNQNMWNSGHLTTPQARGDPVDSSFAESQPAQASSSPHIQKDPVLYSRSRQPQHTPVLFTSQPHPAALTQPHQAEVSAPPPNERSQVTSTAADGLPGFITSENDAEVVIDVISSLLQNYLKYRLQALPGSFMKLLRKSAKNEESVTRINKLSTGQTAKQIFINTQNHKNKTQSVFPSDGERSSQSVLYDRRSGSANRSSNTGENEHSPYRENVRTQSMGGKNNNLYNSSKATNEICDSYDQRSYIEDQLRKAAAARSLVGKQDEDKSFKQYGSPSSRERALENTMQTKPSITDFSKRYISSYDEDNFPRNESTSNESFSQYRRSMKEDTSSQNIWRNEPSGADFSNRYRSSGLQDSSRSGHQNSQSVDLFKRYRSPNKY